MREITVRPAIASEQKALEALQWRASLSNSGDRERLLANPDAIELPLLQIESGGVFVAEVAGSIVGFAAILPRADGDSELDALFVEPLAWRQGTAAGWLITAPFHRGRRVQRPFMSAATRMPKASTARADSNRPAPSRRALESACC